MSKLDSMPRLWKGACLEMLLRLICGPTVDYSGFSSSAHIMAQVLPISSTVIVRRVNAYIAACTAQGRFVFVRDATSRTAVSLDSACTRSDSEGASSLYSTSWVDRDADGREMEHAIAP